MGRPTSEEEHRARGWARLSLRLPPDAVEALDRLTADGESPGLVIRRLLLAAAKIGSPATIDRRRVK